MIITLTSNDVVISVWILKRYFYFIGENYWELFSDAKGCGSNTGLLCAERKQRFIQQAAFVVSCWIW